jgi:hypothetical protein
MAKPAINSLPTYLQIWVNTSEKAATTAEKIISVREALASGVTLRQMEREARDAITAQLRTGGPSLNKLSVLNIIGEAFAAADRDIREAKDLLAQKVFTASGSPANDPALVFADLKAGATFKEIEARHLAGDYKKEKAPAKSIATVIAGLLATAAEKDLTNEERALIADAMSAYNKIAPKVQVPAPVETLVNA